MYDSGLSKPEFTKRFVSRGAHSDASFVALSITLIGLLSATVSFTVPLHVFAQELKISAAKYNPSIIHEISSQSEKLELTTNSSRILTLGKKIPRVQVNNPELLTVTPLSDKDIQISAKKVGITQINLWDEDDNIHTVDVLIYGDVQELEHALKVQFPHSSIKVFRYTESLVLKGFVDQPTHVSQIQRLAEDYAPKIINNIDVGGVQQVLLKVKVMEVSRTKLRRLGVDLAYLGGNGSNVVSSVSGLISSVTSAGGAASTVATTGTIGGQSFQFGIVNGNNAFFGFLDALQQNRIAKILAEPNLVAISGRPAQFNVGGEFPILIPQSLGTASIEFKPYGTQVDFLPIVLGNGNIRLEVRPRISEIDPARSVTLNGNNIPALTVRQVDTAVEMKAGQTFALAGLVQERVESLNRGLPYLSDIPVFGVPFRKVEETINEIELLIMVTPELVDAMDPSEVPYGGPGLETVSPTNEGFYCGGHLEVPPHCNPIRGPRSCDNCGGGGCVECGIQNSGCSSCGCSDGSCSCGQGNAGYSVASDDGYVMPGGSGYDDGSYSSGPTIEPLPAYEGAQHGELALPPVQQTVDPLGGSTTGVAPTVGPQFSTAQSPATRQATLPRSYSPQRQPVYLRQATNPNSPNNASPRNRPAGQVPALIGPVGYDVQ